MTGRPAARAASSSRAAVVSVPTRSISARKNGANAPSGPTMSFCTCTATSAVRVGSMVVMVVLRVAGWLASGVGEDRGADVGDVALGGEGVGQEDADHVHARVEHQLGLLLQLLGGAVEAPVVDQLL